jgi:cytochrome P450
MQRRFALAPVIQEATRFEPSTSTTIRFVAEDTVIAGQLVKAGDVIIVSIASANRDPTFNVDPGRFDALRSDRRCLEFGTGAHACPANRLAPLMAEVLVDLVTYAPSAHVRIPRFGGG